MLFICAMKMEATVTKSAVPSMLTVAPMGRTNLEMRGSTLFFSIQRKVMGRAAALQQKVRHVAVQCRSWIERVATL